MSKTMENSIMITNRPCHSSDHYLTVARRSSQGQSGHVIWDLWWTKWNWGQFPPGALSLHQFSFCQLLYVHPIIDTVYLILKASLSDQLKKERKKE
jgi:hypothetical protein